MVFYFASPKYNPLINKVLTETDQVIAESIVGNDLFLKKTMKDKLASIASIDIIIVDFTALADTDAEIMEAVESIRIMDYKVRFIFVMPYKAEGDPFLKECFYAGIYDLIISDQYLEISEQLAVCVTEGMRYKDALKYRDAAINDQPKEAAISRKTMIGIAGAGIRSGATHNSIVLGNFLRANNQMTAVLEYAQRPAMQSVCEATGASFYNEGYFSLKGVDYYPECDRERLTAVAGRLYDYIIMDFGNYADADQILFNKCDVRIIISGSKPWELANLEEVFRSQEEEVLKKYHFCFLGTTNNRLQKEIIKHMEPLENIYFLEYNEDPLACDHFPEGFEILRDYLEPVKKEKKKKSFFGKKRG